MSDLRQAARLRRVVLIRHWTVAVVSKFLDHPFHLSVVEDVRVAGGGCVEIEFSQSLGLSGQREGLIQVTTEDHEPVVGHQCRAATVQSRDNIGGECIGAKGSLGRAADLGTTEEWDQIVHGGKIAA